MQARQQSEQIWATGIVSIAGGAVGLLVRETLHPQYGSSLEVCKAIGRRDMMGERRMMLDRSLGIRGSTPAELVAALRDLTVQLEALIVDRGGQLVPVVEESPAEQARRERKASKLVV